MTTTMTMQSSFSDCRTPCSWWRPVRASFLGRVCTRAPVRLGPCMYHCKSLLFFYGGGFCLLADVAADCLSLSSRRGWMGAFGRPSSPPRFTRLICFANIDRPDSGRNAGKVNNNSTMIVRHRKLTAAAVTQIFFLSLSTDGSEPVSSQIPFSASRNARKGNLGQGSGRKRMGQHSNIRNTHRRISTNAFASCGERPTKPLADNRQLQFRPLRRHPTVQGPSRAELSAPTQHSLMRTDVSLGAAVSDALIC